MASNSQEDCVVLSKSLVRFAEAEIAKEKGPFRITHAQVATYLGVSRSLVQAVLCDRRTFGKKVFERAAGKMQMEVGSFIEFLSGGLQVTSVPSKGSDQLEMVSALSAIVMEIGGLIRKAEALLGVVVLPGKGKPVRVKGSRKKT